jgi:biopolymer transport protein ExbB
MNGLNAFVDDTWSIWQSGGWAMIAIAVTAVVMFAVGLSVFVRLMGKGHSLVSERTWRRWIDHPEERRGRIGELLDVVTGGRSLEDTAVTFDQLRATEVTPFERDLKVMKVCVSAAPLLGLLGTVTGMLTTFGALATGSGGDKTMGMVAGGISEALITTETGLVIALPGLFLQYQLARQHARYKAFLAHLQTVCTQSLYRHLRKQ